MLIGHRYGRVAVERGFASQHLEQHHAQGVDVGAIVGRVAFGLLWREVGGGAHDCACLGEVADAAGDRSGDAEIRNLQPRGRREHDVARLHISVDHILLVGVG